MQVLGRGGGWVAVFLISGGLGVTVWEYQIVVIIDVRSRFFLSNVIHLTSNIKGKTKITINIGLSLLFQSLFVLTNFFTLSDSIGVIRVSLLRNTKVVTFDIHFHSKVAIDVRVGVSVILNLSSQIVFSPAIFATGLCDT